MFCGSIVALVTPFDKEGEIDQRALEALVHWHLEEGTDAIVCYGSTGEASTLSHEEQLHVLKTLVRIAKGKIPVIAGTGSNNTRQAVQNTKDAKACGADGCLVVVPYYNRPTPQGCIAHFQEVAKVGLPMIIYHHPGRTAVKLGAQTLLQICDIQQVVGIEEGSMDLELVLELMKLPLSPCLQAMIRCCCRS